jgi:hypothetical protein
MPGFEEWAVVELMGHQKIAGKVSEQSIAGGSMLRVDVPDVPGQAGFTRYIGTAAIYAINPCSEDVARRAAAYHQVQPIRPYELAPALPAMTEAQARRRAEAAGEFPEPILVGGIVNAHLRTPESSEHRPTLPFDSGDEADLNDRAQREADETIDEAPAIDDETGSPDIDDEFE